jgi:1-acyl-sn-glycerol-3-phosphate acyltransferase
MTYNVIRGIVSVFFHLFFRIEIKGLDNVPKSEGILVCPNHYTNWDPLLVGITFPRKVRFLAKHDVFKIPVIGYLLKKAGMIPVKRGEADINAIKTTIKALKENQAIGLFPEGTRIKGGELGKANPGVAMFSIKSGKSVLPVLVSGNYKLFSKLKVTVGEPINFNEHKKDKMTNDDYLEISQIVMDKIRELKMEDR